MPSSFSALITCVLLAISAHAHAQFVHTKGAEIVDRDGKPLLLIGPNLGNWLVFEGYMLDIDEPGWSTPTGFRAGIKHALGGDEKRTAEFVRKMARFVCHSRNDPADQGAQLQQCCACPSLISCSGMAAR